MNKKCQVVMLPTNKKSNSGIRNTFPTPKTQIGDLAFLDPTLSDKDICWDYQHLYILSDDQIKKDDWVYDRLEKIVLQVCKSIDGG